MIALLIRLFNRLCGRNCWLCDGDGLDSKEQPCRLCRGTGRLPKGPTSHQL